VREPAEQLRQRKAEDQRVEDDEVTEAVQCRSPRALGARLLRQSPPNVERGRMPAGVQASG
jgi:hypothetical protein